MASTELLQLTIKLANHRARNWSVIVKNFIVVLFSFIPNGHVKQLKEVCPIYFQQRRCDLCEGHEHEKTAKASRQSRAKRSINCNWWKHIWKKGGRHEDFAGVPRRVIIGISAVSWHCFNIQIKKLKYLLLHFSWLKTQKYKCWLYSLALKWISGLYFFFGGGYLIKGQKSFTCTLRKINKFLLSIRFVCTLLYLSVKSASD